MQKKIYRNSVIYAGLMVFFGVVSYLFLYSGFKTESKLFVSYSDNSNVDYVVNYYDDMDNSSNYYVSKMTSSIDFNYNYEYVISEYITGFYKYQVDGYLKIVDDEGNILWERDVVVNDEVTKLIDQNKVNSFKISDSFLIDFAKYRSDVLKVIEKYGVDGEGILSVNVTIVEEMNLSSLDKVNGDTKVIKINIPLTDDTFKIQVENIDEVDSYYEFSSKRMMNLFFLILGGISGSIAFAIMVVVIRQFLLLKSKETKYTKMLREIVGKYDADLVHVNKLYVNKKYNMIYVDSFSELMDVSKKYAKIINYKETSPGSITIFVVFNDSDAWIYRLVSYDIE